MITLNRSESLLPITMKTITILAIIAILAVATTYATMGLNVISSALAQTDNATMAGNLTGGNLTGGNLTGGNTTDAVGTISGGGRG
jgi:hypothetical protein